MSGKCHSLAGPSANGAAAIQLLTDFRACGVRAFPKDESIKPSVNLSMVSTTRIANPWFRAIKTSSLL